MLSTLWLPLAVLALLAAAVTVWWLRQRADQKANRESLRSALQSVHASNPLLPLSTAQASNQPQPALVLGSVERKAYRLLREAFPRAEVLAHVPLLRFIRMPPHEQRARWLQDVGALNADLLLCDSRFRVLTVVDVRTRRDTASSHQRNERMAQVLQAAGIAVHVWHEEKMPSVSEIRKSIAPALAAKKAAERAASVAIDTTATTATTVTVDMATVAFTATAPAPQALARAHPPSATASPAAQSLPPLLSISDLTLPAVALPALSTVERAANLSRQVST